MNKIFNKKSFNGAVYLVLSVFFLTCFPAGALALCLDEEENHLFDQNLNLVDCHSSVEADLILSDEHCSALTERENKDCLDVSLANANSLNLPSKVFLPDFTKVIFTFLLQSAVLWLHPHRCATGSARHTHPPHERHL